MTLAYPGGSRVITRVLARGRPKVKEEAGDETTGARGWGNEDGPPAKGCRKLPEAGEAVELDSPLERPAGPALPTGCRWALEQILGIRVPDLQEDNVRCLQSACPESFVPVATGQELTWLPSTAGRSHHPGWAVCQGAAPWSPWNGPGGPAPCPPVAGAGRSAPALLWVCILTRDSAPSQFALS